MPQLQVEHLIEVAIVKLAAVADAERGAAHQVSNGRRIETVDKQFEILVPFALFVQVLGEAGDRLIGNREKFVEDDTELASQNQLVIGFQLRLRSGQFRPERVIDQME